MEKDYVEALAAHCHEEQWSGWMRYLFSKCETLEGSTIPGSGTPSALIIPSWAVERWERQMSTPYEDLSEEEKESDRKEARAIMEVIGLEAGKEVSFE